MTAFLGGVGEDATRDGRAPARSSRLLEVPDPAIGDVNSLGLFGNLWTSPSLLPVRHRHAMAYDAQSGRIILFGGVSGAGGYIGDTWAYDLEANVWTSLSPPSGPTPRRYHAMAYDVQSDRVVLFGGQDVTGLPGDTWAYDLEANVWMSLSPPS